MVSDKTDFRTAFRNLQPGDTFDWIDDDKPGHNSFFLRCTKLSPRRYQDERGIIHRVGSGYAECFHVRRDGKSLANLQEQS